MTRWRSPAILLPGPAVMPVSADIVAIVGDDPPRDATRCSAPRGRADGTGRFRLRTPLGPWSNDHRLAVTSGVEPTGFPSPVAGRLRALGGRWGDHHRIQHNKPATRRC